MFQNFRRDSQWQYWCLLVLHSSISFAHIEEKGLEENCCFEKKNVFWEDIQKFVATFFSNKNMRLMKLLGIWKLKEMPLEQPPQLQLPKSFVGKECCDIFLDIFQKHIFFFKTTNFFETVSVDGWKWYWRVKCKKTLVLSLTVTSEILKEFDKI